MLVVNRLRKCGAFASGLHLGFCKWFAIALLQTVCVSAVASLLLQVTRDAGDCVSVAKALGVMQINVPNKNQVVAQLGPHSGKGKGHPIGNQKVRDTLRIAKESEGEGIVFHGRGVLVNYVFGRANANRNCGSLDAVASGKGKGVLLFELGEERDALRDLLRANAADLRADRAERLNFGRGLHAL